jgi:hypothetical protein
MEMLLNAQQDLLYRTHAYVQAVGTQLLSKNIDEMREKENQHSNNNKVILMLRSFSVIFFGFFFTLKMSGLPASPALSNVALNADPELSIQAVPAGSVDAAVIGREHQRKRKLARISQDSLGVFVSEQEVGDAVLRESQAVSIALLGQAAPGGVQAPAWFGPALNAALAPIHTNLNVLNTSVAAINAKLAPLDAKLDVISDSVHRLESGLDNQRIFRKNNQVIRFYMPFFLISIISRPALRKCKMLLLTIVQAK